MFIVSYCRFCNFTFTICCISKTSTLAKAKTNKAKALTNKAQ